MNPAIDPDEAQKLFVEDLTSTLQVIALDAKFQVDFNPDVVAYCNLTVQVRPDRIYQTRAGGFGGFDRFENRDVADGCGFATA